MGCVLHGLINLKELDQAARSDGRQVHLSCAKRYKACRDSSLRCLVPAGGQQHPWSWDGAFPFTPMSCHPREAFLKGLSTTGWLLLDWGKPEAAHAKSWFSFFPS